MYFLKRNKIKNQPGYSFIEVMVAVFLVTTGLLAAVFLISKSLGQSLDSRDQQVADLLAQEGVELVRNVRDNDWLSGAQGFANIIVNPNCRMSTGPGLLCNQGAGLANYRLYLDASKAYYIQAGAPDKATKFYRKISIQKLSVDPAPLEYAITSMVIWGGSSWPALASCNVANKCVYSTVNLYNWGG